MPVLNNRESTQRTVQSIGRQHPFIIFDNGSPPGTLDFAQELPDCTVLHSPRNLGVAPAWNALFDEAFRRGAESAFCTNNDVIYLPNSYEALAEVVEEHPEAGIISMAELPTDFANFRQAPVCTGYRFSMFLLRRSTWETVGKFDTRFRPIYWEDTDYVVRLRAAGVQAIQTLRAAGFHAHFGASRGLYGRVRRAYIMNRNRWKFILKHGWHTLAPIQRRFF
jgi:GT2 family glycosyltransferase